MEGKNGYEKKSPVPVYVKEDEQSAFTDLVAKKNLDSFYTEFIKYLQPDAILDKFVKYEYLDAILIRNIREQKTTTEKNRIIIDEVKKRGHDGYDKFKMIMGETQLELHTIERNERKIAEDVLKDIFLDRNPSDCEIATMAFRIGDEWRQLGCFLKLTKACMSQIEMDNPKSADRIFNMLMEWRRMFPLEGTFRTLKSALISADGDVDLIFENFSY